MKKGFLNISNTILSGTLLYFSSCNSKRQRKSYRCTIKQLAMDQRHRNHHKSYKKALKADRKMKTIAESMGGRCDFNIVREYPFLINEEKLTGHIHAIAEEYLGKENVLDADIWMAEEYFAYYSQVTDSCFYPLGTGNKEKGIASSLHTPTFNIDENALALSTGLMAYITVKQLGN